MDNLKIVGGEFEIFPELKTDGLSNGRMPGTAGERYYTSGRTCLYAILKSIADISGGTGGVLVPDYICASVTRTIMDTGHRFSFYKIGRNLCPDMESVYSGLQRQKIILLVNYFGMVDLKSTISSIRRISKDSVIIVDNVQDYYGFGRVKGFDYAFTSFRKWFPVPDGAKVIAKDKRRCDVLPEYIGTNRFARYKLVGNMMKGFRGEMDDSVCLKLLEEGERILDEEYLCGCTDYSLAAMQKMDIGGYAEKRKNNAKILHEGLEWLGIAHIYKKDIVPFFVPIILKNRDKIRGKLFGQCIFCPVHWPHESEELQGNNILYSEELSLICDQRYDENDMRLIVEILEHECKDL